MNPVVITPLIESTGLDIARDMQRHGIETYGIDCDPKVVSRFSNACKFILCPDYEKNDGEDFLQFLVDFGRRQKEKIVLFPIKDWHVLFVSKHRKILEPYYAFVMPEDQLIVDLTTKDGLLTIAQKLQIPAPHTYKVTGEDNIGAISDKISYPVIIKPTESTYWQNENISRLFPHKKFGGRPKVIYCEDPNELIESYEKILTFDDRVIIQEVIPGEDHHLVYISFYLNRESELLGYFAGRKIRVFPVGFGSASYVKSMHDQDLVDIALKLVLGVRYQGLGGIEFKMDPRDQKYKLIEFNTRYGLWDGLGIKCGVDLPYIAYRDALGLPVEPQFEYRDNVIWVDWERDIRAALIYRSQGKLTISQYLQSLKGERMSAVFNRKDWRPGIQLVLSLIPKFFAKLISRN